VGRRAEGQDFFNLIKETLDQAKSTLSIDLLELNLETFSLEDTKIYFEYLADGWEKPAVAASKTTANTFRRLARDDNRLEVLWRYTGGQPVRLALYADLIVEGQTIPTRLQDTPDEVQKKLPDNLAEGERTQKLAAIQTSIEAEFIHLLFSRTNLRAEILKTLVRAPRGLNTQQLYIALQPGLFGQTMDAEFEREIEQELGTLRQLSIVKVRPEERLGLQDEIYHIYAQIMTGSKQNRADEINARQKMAQRLENWADYQLKQFKIERQRLIDEDESKLAFASRPTRTW